MQRWPAGASGDAVVLGGCLLEQAVGRGGTGEVWRGRRVDTGEPVAVKLLRSTLAEDDEVVRRFFGMRQTLTQLRHQNLVAVRDLVAEGGALAVVMDLVDGVDLRRTMRRSPLRAEEALRVLAQIALALEYVHDSGLVHRAVKPQNVLVERSEVSVTARLSDYGIAHLAESAAAHTGGPQLTQPLNGVAYVAPDLIGGGRITPAADVYSLGVLAYELFTGRPPTGERHPNPPPGVPDRLWETILSCLAFNPAERPAAGTLITEFIAPTRARTIADPPPDDTPTQRIGLTPSRMLGRPTRQRPPRPDADRPDRARPDRRRTERGRADRARPDRERPDQDRPDRGRPDRDHPDRGRPDRRRPGPPPRADDRIVPIRRPARPERSARRPLLLLVALLAVTLAIFAVVLANLPEPERRSRSAQVTDVHPLDVPGTRPPGSAAARPVPLSHGGPQP
jgi:serine/threonine protein kinase